MADEKFGLTQKQSDAWWDYLEAPQYRRILFDGGGRATKTFLICLWLITEAKRYAGIPILIARKYREHAKDSLFNDTLRKVAGDSRAWTFRESDLEMHHRNGSFIRIGGLDDKDRVDKILGTEYAHVFFNEATQISWPTFQMVLTRLAHTGVPVRKAILDCNPKNQRHWLYKAGIMRVNPADGKPLPDADTWVRQHWTPYDNPHLPPDALATYEAMTGVMRRRMLDGEWCDLEGAVYPEFSEEDIADGGHVFTDFPAGFADWPRYRAIDFGYTNPFVCIWAALDPDGRLWLYREHYRTQLTVKDHAAIIRAAEYLPHCLTVADHDAEDRATLAQEGIQTQAARKATGPGRDAVKTRLTSRRLFVHSSMREIIGEFLDYAWAPATEGRADKEEPIKDRDHGMDALRYLVMHFDHAEPRPGEIYRLETAPINQIIAGRRNRSVIC